MKYSHRKEQMERNRLKNLANPNFEKKQVKYDREKKKREEKRNLRMQAIINGVEIDMSYLRGMSNRQRKKEEARIREAKKQREEQLATMGLGTTSGSRESSPPSSDEDARNVKLNGDTLAGEDSNRSINREATVSGDLDLQADGIISSSKKRKNPVDARPEEEGKQKKAQKKSKGNGKAELEAASHHSSTEKEPKSGDNDESHTRLDGVDNDGFGEIDGMISTARLDDSDSSGSSDGEDDGGAAIADTVDDVTQARSESEDQQSKEADDAEEDIPLSDLDSLGSEEKGDIIPHQRLSINNHAALNKAYKSIALPYSKLQFSDHMSTTTTDAVQIADINDDLNRELAFYKQSLEAVNHARPRLKKESVPFSRPVDYFAEMVKSDEHMGKIKQKLVDEAAGRKAAADARKQRDLKKFGKQVQIAKQQERAKEKRDTMEKINVLKRKRQNAGMDEVDESELFDVALEDAAETDRKERAARKAVASGGKSNPKRQKRDEKYGFGGKKRHAKSNDANSTNDMSGYSTKKMKGKRDKKDKKHRPGKSRRASAKA